MACIAVILKDISAGKQQTFQQLRNSSLEIGRGLQTQWNWKRGHVMAVFAPNSADIAAITFATLWAGGVVCPINNLYTVGELASLVESSGAKGLTTHLSCLEVAREAAFIAGLPLDRIILIGDSDPKGKVKHFSSLMTAEANFDRTEKVLINPKEELAFLVYSSGTTGLPKGVMLSHENIVTNVLQSCTPDREMLDWKNDSMVSFLPMFHIYGKLKSLTFASLFMYLGEFELTGKRRSPRHDPRPPLPRTHNAHHGKVQSGPTVFNNPRKSNNRGLRRSASGPSSSQESSCG
jgi:4-coumarate--CoA ligase